MESAQNSDARRTAAIVVVTRNLPPLRGGIERLMLHTVEELGRRRACDVVGPAGCRAHLPAARTVCELPPRLPWFHLRAMPHLVAARGYALVIAGSGLVAPLARIAARGAGCPYAVFVHGLDLIVDNAVYQRLFLPSIRAAAAVIANSAYTAELARQRGIASGRIHVLNPGVAAPARADGASFRVRHGLQQRPLLLSVGRLVPRKGIAEFVEQALPAVLSARPDACLVVVGDEPDHSIGRSPGTREAIRRAAARVGATGSVLLLGGVGDSDLAHAYAAADAFVFPVQDLPGDVEGFGMVALEAAAHGVPTAAFAVGGVVDAVSPSNGLLAAPGDYAGLARAVIDLLRQDCDLSAESCRQHAAGNDWSIFGRRLNDIVDGLM